MEPRFPCEECVPEVSDRVDIGAPRSSTRSGTGSARSVGRAPKPSPAGRVPWGTYADFPLHGPAEYRCSPRLLRCIHGSVSRQPPPLRGSPVGERGVTRGQSAVPGGIADGPHRGHKMGKPLLSRGLHGGAGDRDRTGMASLEGWGSAIELHPRRRRATPGGHDSTTGGQVGNGGVATRREVPTQGSGHRRGSTRLRSAPRGVA